MLSYADAPDILSPFLGDMKLMGEIFFFFSCFWYLASAALGQLSNTSESPSVQKKKKQMTNMYMCA